MSSQASVHSIDSLKDLRVTLALYGEETLAALGAVEAEVRRTVRWLQEERPYYWQEQIKRRREMVSQARAEVFKKNLQKRADYTPPMSEQKENLRKAEASLVDAEKRLTMVRKWQPIMQQAVLEYHGSIQRLKDLAASDIPRAVTVLTKLIDALEAYLRVTPPSAPGLEAPAAASGSPNMASPQFVSIATKVFDEAEAAAREEALARAQADDGSARGPRATPPPPPPWAVDSSCQRPTPISPPSIPLRHDAEVPHSASDICLERLGCLRMPNAKVLAGSTRLSQTVRAVRDQWLITEATWNDSVRQRFEERHLAPLAPAVDSAVNGLQKIAEILDQVRRDCSDRSEAL